ncbi:MAG: hypothetical protein R8G01_21035 [Ilumatobacteraceae bacterium]|nr:hypothetical protein [Ilumatobacteraceae bacterium]
MGPDIIIPVIVVAVLVPGAIVWAKKNFKDRVGDDHDDVAVPPSDRLTSNALRELSTPPWRVVYEVAPGRLGGIGHVLIGPAGVFALRTTMDPLPQTPAVDADASAIAQAAIARGGVDDALRRCAMSSDRLVVVHWGVNDTAEIKVDLMPGVIAVDGRSLATWAATAGPDTLSPAQVDLAWQTVVTSIGRPDPLA